MRKEQFPRLSCQTLWLLPWLADRRDACGRTSTLYHTAGRECVFRANKFIHIRCTYFCPGKLILISILLLVWAFGCF